MAKINLRAVVRQTKYYRSNKKPNYSKILQSWFKTALYKHTIVKKRPRCLNWFYGKNKF